MMMIRRTVVSGIAMMLAAASLTLSAYAQQPSTAFTYQGFLKDNNNPANAKYDLQFTLYDAPTGGNPIGNPVVIDDLEITNGLFTVEIDFGINPFSSGQRRWIQIGIRPFNSTRPFIPLDPRIELTPVPYAIYAQKAKDAENAQNAQNAQNARNAQDAVNAVTAAVANSVAPDSVDSAGLANDANSLSKVSGGNLSITSDGYLKNHKPVYYRATRFFTYGNQISTPSGFIFYSLVPSSSSGRGWYALRMQDTGSEYANVAIASNDAGPESDDSAGTQITVPVGGYYIVKFVGWIYQSWIDNNPWCNGQPGIQVKRPSSSWEIIDMAESASYASLQFDSTQAIALVYLPAGTIIRPVGYRGNVLWTTSFRDPRFEILLLYAADAPNSQ
jgi:hypothetical protein